MVYKVQHAARGRLTDDDRQTLGCRRRLPSLVTRSSVRMLGRRRLFIDSRSMMLACELLLPLLLLNDLYRMLHS